MRKPKILHVLNVFRPGAIPHILRDIYPVVRDRYEFEIVALEGKQTGTPIAGDMNDLGIPVHAPHEKTSAIARHYSFLKQEVLRRNADIVHAHMGRAILLAPFCTPREVNVCATFHGMKEGFHPLSRMGLKAIDGRLHARTYVSSAVARSWDAQPSSRSRVIPNPVDIERFSASEADARRIRLEFDIPNDLPLLVVVGRLVPAKGHDVLLHALKSLREKSSSRFRLVIAGKGPEEARLQALTAALGLADCVHFAGFRDDVPALVAAADIGLLPSLWEGFGLAAVEAMAAGTAVIASDLPGIREYLHPDVTGIACPAGDPQALAQAIDMLIANPGLRGKIAAAGQKSVKENFSTQVIGTRYLEFYDTLLAENSRP